MDISAQFVLIAKRILRELSALSQTVSAGFQAIQKQTEATANEQKTKKERGVSPPVIPPEINVLPAMHYQQEAREARNERRDKWKVRIEAATLIFVLVYAIINFFILRAMWKANKTTSDSFTQTLCQMKAQTAAQVNAATAANKAIIQNRIALIISQQASVFFTNEFTAPRLTINGKSGRMFSPTLENGGNTSAFDVLNRVNDNGSIGFSNLPRGFKYPDNPRTAHRLFPTEDVREGPFILAAHKPIGGGVVPIGDEVLQRVNEGKSYVYFWGWATYRDIFGCHHKTEFCSQLVGVNSQDGKFMFKTCPEHNCADQDCRDYQPSKTELCSTVLPK
jgi:hypothetical protein